MKRGVVFIGGSGRCGTSFLFKLLSNQPGVVGFGESEAKFFIEAGGLLDVYRALVTDYNASRSEFALQRFEHLMLRELGNEEFYGQEPLTRFVGPQLYQMAVQRYLGRLRFRGVPRVLLPAEFFEISRDFVDELVSALSPGPDTFVEKTPHSVLHLSFLSALYPEARFVHIVRDPRAVVLSLQRQSWAPSTVEACAGWLKAYHEAFSRQSAAMPLEPVRLRTIRLEDFGQDASTVGSMLQRFCGLTKLDPTLVQVDDKAQSAWRSGAPDSALATIEAVLSEEIERYGYPPTVRDAGSRGAEPEGSGTAALRTRH